VALKERRLKVSERDKPELTPEQKEKWKHLALPNCVLCGEPMYSDHSCKEPTPHLQRNKRGDETTLRLRTNALIEAAEITASAIRNLEGQPIQYSLARDLSAALAVLELTLKRMGSSK
jgi:hypothetical protein